MLGSWDDYEWNFLLFEGAMYWYWSFLFGISLLLCLSCSFVHYHGALVLTFLMAHRVSESWVPSRLYRVLWWSGCAQALYGTTRRIGYVLECLSVGYITVGVCDILSYLTSGAGDPALHAVTYFSCDKIRPNWTPNTVYLTLVDLPSIFSSVKISPMTNVRVRKLIATKEQKHIAKRTMRVYLKGARFPRKVKVRTIIQRKKKGLLDACRKKKNLRLLSLNHILYKSFRKLQSSSSERA